ncbi:MAG: cytochrome c3 family protein [Nitrospirae bacterium YQR-1]
MADFRFGFIGSHISKATVLVFVVIMALVMLPLIYKSWNSTSVECLNCHGNKAEMEKLGYPFFYVTNETAQRESKHPNVECKDCHMGNGRAKDKDTAHKGMLKALFVSEDGNLINRDNIFKGPLLPQGENKIYELLPKVDTGKDSVVPFELRNVLWHDRNPETFNFDPDIAKQTCGAPACHPEELKQFKHSIMGRNYRQRFMKTWLKPYGPHNCGPSFADTPPVEVLKDAGFDDTNTKEIAENLNMPFTKHHAEDKQKFCNVCHAGCLDCHYSPSSKEGVHSFSKMPRSETCAGGGRGTSICHPGAMQSRRGETYIGGDYSIPTGMQPDVHYKLGIHCISCHPTGEKGMGDMERRATCQDCHIDIESAHARSIHRNLDCSTCHISELGGYQITIWGPGKIAGKENPFKKYSLYYGIQSPPIILKDEKGTWRPYKVWPHSVGNIKNNVPPSKSIMYRWPDGQTHDAYFINGTFDGLKANNKHLLWIQFDQAAHPFGRARGCNSCHAKAQLSGSTWEFFDNYGAYPFTGSHTIRADETGLRIEQIQNTSAIELMEGAKPEDFASWLYLKDKWQMPGDFSIKAEAESYAKYLKISDETDRKVKNLKDASGRLDNITRKHIKLKIGVALHNLDESAALDVFFKK